MEEIDRRDSPGLDEATFRRLAELSPEPMLAHAGGRILWANPAAATVMGVGRPEACTGLPVLDFVAPESRALALERLRRMVATGEPAPVVEEVFQRRDGSRLEAEVTAAPIGGGAVLVVFRDIGPRKQAERQRELATRRWRAFFEATSDAIGVSCRGVHVEANAAYARLFGFERPEELVGRPILELIAPAERARIAEHVRRRSTGDPPPEVYLARALRRDGGEFLMEVRVSMVPEGGVEQTVVMVRDVTAEREHEARLAASEARYRELFDQVPVGVWEEDLSGARRILDGLRAAGVTDLAAPFAMSLNAVSKHIRVLEQAGLVRRDRLPLKILGHGEVSVPLFVLADGFTKSAREKIEAAGGTAQVIEIPTEPLAALGVEPAGDAAPAEAPEAPADNG